MGGGTMHVDHLVTQLRNSLNNNFSSSSSSNLNPSHPTDNNTNKTLSSCCCNDKLCRKREITSTCSLYNHLFETVPSQSEVDDAISALQEFMKAISSTITIQQISDSYDSRMMLSRGYKRLYDALQMLQADPAVKRLVVSLSSDEAIWDAVIRNVLHQRLLELPRSVNCERPRISGQREIGMEIISWIFDIMKGKILELMESFQSLMNDLFQSPRIGNATQLDEKVRSSTLLSIVILLIVIMARFQNRQA